MLLEVGLRSEQPGDGVPDLARDQRRVGESSIADAGIDPLGHEVDQPRGPSTISTWIAGYTTCAACARASGTPMHRQSPPAPSPARSRRGSRLLMLADRVGRLLERAHRTAHPFVGLAARVGDAALARRALDQPDAERLVSSRAMPRVTEDLGRASAGGGGEDATLDDAAEQGEIVEVHVVSDISNNRSCFVAVLSTSPASTNLWSHKE